LLREAIDAWKMLEQKENIKISFILQLGDLIDGKCKGINESEASMYRVLNFFKEFKLLNVWGNHEFYNFTRSYLINSQLNTAKILSQNLNSNANYYSIEVTNKLKLICLDLYEFSILGYEKQDKVYEEAMFHLKKYNHNKDLTFVPRRWFWIFLLHFFYTYIIV
jgi:manganese-dependent ADP-ribose/CDP-alcohol diphosphatase